MRRAIVHLPPQKAALAHPRAPGVVGDICQVLQRCGLEPDFDTKFDIAAGVDLDPDVFHILHASNCVKAMPRVYPNAIYAAAAPLRQFWYLDPMGVSAYSSIAADEFIPSALPADRVQTFFERLQRRFVRDGVSKMPQSQERRDFGNGHFAVFLKRAGRDYAGCTANEVEIVQELRRQFPQTRVLVNRNPAGGDAETVQALTALAAEDAALRLVDANVHDVLEGARACISIAAAVSVEAMLHRVPAVVFARTLFHHNVTTLSDAAALRPALDELAAEGPRPDAEYLFWLLRQNCLDLSGKGWKDKAQKQIETALQDCGVLVG
ncbi:hypothetical protein [Thalassobius sp. Cn5-15]|uniref:hypothetical protein n=1 Tax=Thalassobius sp. Cn5-15 TaxID=2917763 RepID=UPI001EF30EBE|nr:hypothetical protein [Thalassobius sp. Cn5-15]MCG7491931.1 hypothetical protein [Thalassobius sp. Cn5-15]